MKINLPFKLVFALEVRLSDVVRIEFDIIDSSNE